MNEYDIYHLVNNEWIPLTDDVQRGLYIVLFHKHYGEDDLYEIRRPNDNPVRTHNIMNNERVLKFGKTESTLFGRYEGSYSTHWKYGYENYPPNGRSYSNCFRDVTSIFLIRDMSREEAHLVGPAENQLKQIVSNTLFVERQEPGTRSEYRRLLDENFNLDDFKTSLIDIVHLINLPAPR